jgi:hypothetical protein
MNLEHLAGPRLLVDILAEESAEHLIRRGLVPVRL